MGNGKQIHFNAGMNLIGGSVYAPTIDLVTNTGAPLQVNGAVLVRKINVGAMLIVRNASAATSAADSCGS